VLLKIAGIDVGMANWLIGADNKLKYGRVWTALLFITLFALAGFISSGGTSLIPGLYLPNIQLPNWQFPMIDIPALGLTGPDVAMITMVLITLAIVWWVSTGDDGEGSSQAQSRRKRGN
jgi:hypothetical protein